MFSCQAQYHLLFWPREEERRPDTFLLALKYFDKYVKFPFMFNCFILDRLRGAQTKEKKSEPMKAWFRQNRRQRTRACDGIYLMLAAAGEPSRLPVQPVFRAELTATLFTAQTKNTNQHIVRLIKFNKLAATSGVWVEIKDCEDGGSGFYLWGKTERRGEKQLSKL